MTIRVTATEQRGLPTDAAARKALPIWRGVMEYFPDVWAEIAKVSVLGNQQHNPGEPLHWARGKSTDQLDAAFRHMLDYSAGKITDPDGMHPLAKAIWRLCAEFQLALENGGLSEALQERHRLVRMAVDVHTK